MKNKKRYSLIKNSQLHEGHMIRKETSNDTSRSSLFWQAPNNHSNGKPL